MMAGRSAYPLSWPNEWPRTTRPGSSQFRTSLPGALKNVEGSIAKFASDSGKKVTDVLVSSNVSLGEQRPKDSGVAIYFTWDEIPTCIAVDRYEKVEDNLQAIHHVLEAERTKLRHGGLNLVRAAFRGYAKLPPPQSDDQPWHRILGIDEKASAKEIKDAYQRLRSSSHPDHGGDADNFHRIKRAFLRAKELGLVS